jgi:hypothetical protein
LAGVDCVVRDTFGFPSSWGFFAQILYALAYVINIRLREKIRSIVEGRTVSRRLSMALMKVAIEADLKLRSVPRNVFVQRDVKGSTMTYTSLLPTFPQSSPPKQAGHLVRKSLLHRGLLEDVRSFAIFSQSARWSSTFLLT